MNQRAGQGASPFKFSGNRPLGPKTSSSLRKAAELSPLFKNLSQKPKQPRGSPFKPAFFGTAVVATLSGFKFGAASAPRNGREHDLLELSGGRATVTKTARLLGTSRGAIYKVAKAYTEGGEEAVKRLRWGGGRPIKNIFLSQAQMDFMVSRRTLTLQIGLSLKARALQFSLRWKKSISATQLRALYRGRGVTLQVPQVRMGPVTLGTDEEQMEAIKSLQE